MSEHKLAEQDMTFLISMELPNGIEPFGKISANPLGDGQAMVGLELDEQTISHLSMWCGMKEMSAEEAQKFANNIVYSTLYSLKGMCTELMEGLQREGVGE